VRIPAAMFAATGSSSAGEAVLVAPGASTCACGSVPAPAPAPGASTCGCGSTVKEQAPSKSRAKARVTLRNIADEFFTTGKRLLVMFVGFAFIGFVLNGLIPSAWITILFGQGNVYSVPLAATLGLPLYINSEASLPLVRALINGGMSQGAAMAFLITGSGTSIGAVAGALTIARWRVLAAVVGTLWVGAVALGFLYNILLVMGLF
jgi:uncharacterized protein